MDGFIRLHPDLILAPAQPASSEKFGSCALFVRGEHNYVIDPSSSREVLTEISGLIQPDRLLITHYHTDHRRNQAMFADLPLTVPHIERDAFLTWASWCEFTGFEGPIGQAVVQWLTSDGGTVLQTPQATLRDGQAIEGMGLGATWVAMPGHTVGHGGVYFKDAEILCVTDIEMGELGPWYGNRASSLADFRATMGQLRGFTQVQRFVTSHDAGVMEAEAFFRELAAFESHFDRRNEMILDLLYEKPRTLEDMAKGRGIVYRPASMAKHAHLWFFESRMIELHLEELAGQQLVGRDQKGVWHAG